MKSVTVCVSVILLGITHATYPPLWTEFYEVHNLEPVYETTFEFPCNNLITNETALHFQQAFYGTMFNFLRKTIELSDAHYTLSPYTIWKTLAAIAEGSEGQTRKDLFRFLNLPEDICTRLKYYSLSLGQEYAERDVVLEINQYFIADSSVVLNRNWEDFVKSQQLIDVATVPYKSNPSTEIENWRQTFNAQLPNINLNGNSLILESLDYHGLWTFAFTEVKEEPFYDGFGEQIATIEYMKIRKAVRIGYLPSLSMKVLELPVGKDSRFKMLFGLILAKSGQRTEKSAFRSNVDTIQSSAVFDAFSSLKRSQVPVEVAIPRFTMTSEIDLRKVLEEIGIKELWADTYATRNISQPAALPSAYIHRVTLTLEKDGVRPTLKEYSSFIPAVPSEESPYSSNVTGLDPTLEQDYILNRPFLYALFDSETSMCLFGGSFSKPT